MGILDVFSTKIDDRPSFKDASDFARTAQPLENTDYDWVFVYSKDLYEKYRTIYKELDDKANEIIKYLGGGAGLFTLAVLLNISARNAPIVIWAIPSFFLSLVSVGFAIATRQPHWTCLPPPATTAFEYANKYGDAQIAQGAFVGEWHLACEGMNLRIADKALWVKCAIWLFYGAILFLLLPILVAIGSPTIVGC